MKAKVAAMTALAALWMWRRNGLNTDPGKAPDGVPKENSTLLLETGAALLQGKSPLSAMNLYLNGFHFLADDMGRQMEAHHYCSQVNEEFTQCVIFDGNRRNARLIGVEYIISERLFASLPEEEKKLWHSHHYEVKSGTLIAAGIPERIERQLMSKILTTYGKTWHTWTTDKESLPLGIPALMMGFTQDGQLDSELLEGRDTRFGIRSEDRRFTRQSIQDYLPLEGANVWESQKTFQLKLEEKNFS